MNARASHLAVCALFAGLAGGGLGGAGCGTSGSSAASSRGTDSNIAGEPSGTLVVFAAASLTDAFEAVGADFEQRYPSVDVKFSFAGSQSLRTQIENGARAQVFASANPKHMDALIASGLAESSRTFAHNKLVVVVPDDNPASITSLRDLPRAKRLVLADTSVPAGMYAAKVLDNAGKAYGAGYRASVDSQIVSRENHVRQTLHKVALGEADAALVYATDAASAGDKVQSFAIEAELNTRASYPVAVLGAAKNAHLGQLFIRHLMSQPGQERLEQFGFQSAVDEAPHTAVVTEEATPRLPSPATTEAQKSSLAHSDPG